MVDLAFEESLSVPVFRLRARNATEPRALAVAKSIFKDEAFHRAFAWDVVDELTELLGVARARAESLAWGLIARPEHYHAIQDAMRDDVLPGLKARGLLEDEATLDALRAELS